MLNPGDRVLVRILAHDGKHKLADKWENHAYIVAEHPNVDIPVYVVKRENGFGETRKLHRNHLLPVNYLPIQVPKQPDKLPPRRQQRHSRKVAEKSPEVESDGGASESESESHDGV